MKRNRTEQNRLELNSNGVWMTKSTEFMTLHRVMDSRMHQK